MDKNFRELKHVFSPIIFRKFKININMGCIETRWIEICNRQNIRLYDIAKCDKIGICR